MLIIAKTKKLCQLLVVTAKKSRIRDRFNLNAVYFEFWRGVRMGSSKTKAQVSVLENNRVATKDPMEKVSTGNFHE